MTYSCWRAIKHPSDKVAIKTLVCCYVQSGAYMLPVQSYAQSIVLPDDLLAFQEVEHSLQLSSGHMVS